MQASATCRSELFEGLRRGSLAGVALAALLLPPVRSPSTALASGRPSQSLALMPLPTSVQRGQRSAEFHGEMASPMAREVADWVARTRDNGVMDFVIVDKKHTKVFVFDAQARLRAATPVLLGAAPGDESVPGIGTRPIAQVRPAERTTPAGRFIGERGRNALGEDVVWVDYDAAVSMHRVRASNPAERRLERLASATTDDNRISYGCINVPVAFYEAFVRPTFAQRRGVVYVLPESKPLQAVFATAPATMPGRMKVAAAAPGLPP